MIAPSVQMMSPVTLYAGRRFRKLRFLMTDNSLLDPRNDITLSSLQRAAAMVGCRVTINLV
jgi:hypothetical protein